VKRGHEFSCIGALVFFLFINELAAQPSQEEESLFLSVHLPYGISIEVPRSWRIVVGEGEKVLEPSVPGNLDLSDLRPLDNKVLFRAAATLADRPASMSVALFSKGMLTLQQAIELSPSGLADYDRALRHQIESAFKNQGVELLAWNGTYKERLNGRLALVSAYRRRSQESPAVWEQINAIPLDGRGMILTVALSEKAGSFWRSMVMRIRSSCRVNPESSS